MKQQRKTGKRIFMDKYTKEILELLKVAFENAVGAHSYQTETGARAYYLQELNDNFYSPMSKETAAAYGTGSGNEIASGKMNALRSSSAMTYNLLGNGPVEIISSLSLDNGIHRIGGGQYRLEFEKQYPTLKAAASNRPANLDAFLYCKETEEAVACEMKMTEWVFNKPGTLKIKYLDPANYIDEEAGKVFVQIARELILWNDYDAQEKVCENYPCRMARYDAFQMFKHTIALYNACSKNEQRKIRKLTLVNCVWTLPDPNTLSKAHRDRYRFEEKCERYEFDEFRGAMRPVKKLFTDVGVDFEIEFYTFGEFLSLIKKSEEEQRYLRRYTDFTTLPVSAHNGKAADKIDVS